MKKNGGCYLSRSSILDLRLVKIFHNVYLIRIYDSIQPMRDREHCTTPEVHSNGGLYQSVSLSIHIGRRLIQDQYRVLPHYRTS